ncbi:hypothetical protein JTE90_014502 [Oedothorax gibbosus]|uniref:Uncharacterized protein n=1 Tax=Oedothorax gibbosus TaxID=931172 RepID=A0AAV6VJ81_9ARAC|nr:hypothetical protein JTE90_014502 [Oedothorax gibbosus]
MAFTHKSYPQYSASEPRHSLLHQLQPDMDITGTKLTYEAPDNLPYVYTHKGPNIYEYPFRIYWGPVQFCDKEERVQVVK